MKYMYKITRTREYNGITFETDHYFSKKFQCYNFLRRLKPEQLKDGIIHEFRERDGIYTNHKNEIVVYTRNDGEKHWNLPIP